MKKDDKIALHGKSADELVRLLSEKQSQLIQARLEAAMHKVKNVHSVLGLRKEIAVIVTVKRAMELVKGK